jgi:hypothetical protein
MTRSSTKGRGPSDLARANHQVGIERMVPVGRGVTAGTQLEQPVHRGGRCPDSSVNRFTADTVSAARTILPASPPPR